MKKYEGKSKAWYFLIISLRDIHFGLVRKCDEIAHDAWKALVDKYEALDKKQESLNEVTNRWKKCKIKDTRLDPYIWFYDLYNLNLNLDQIKAKF